MQKQRGKMKVVETRKGENMSKPSIRIESWESQKLPRPIHIDRIHINPISVSSSIEIRLRQISEDFRQDKVIVRRTIEEATPLEPEVEQKIEKPRVLISHNSLKTRLLKRCVKTSEGHWLVTDWKKSDAPFFSLDGKNIPIRDAAFVLFEQGSLLEGHTVISTCGFYNCVAPGCMKQVIRELARNAQKLKQEEIDEIFRLHTLGKTENEISRLLKRVSPHDVYCVLKGLTKYAVSYAI